MMAQRHNVSPLHYVNTRTLNRFRLDISAWVETWAFPMQMAMGGRKGADKRPGRGQRSNNSAGRTAPQRRRKAGWKYYEHDLGPLKGEEITGSRDEWDRAAAALAGGWSRNTGGTGLTTTPFAEKYGKSFGDRSGWVKAPAGYAIPGRRR